MEFVATDSAPSAIGPYSQAVIVGDYIFTAGQIALDPATMELVDGDIDRQIVQVFENLAAVARAARGDLDDVVKLNVYLVDLAHFPRVNEIMARYFESPYPARAAVQIAALPRGAAVEMDAVMHVGI